MICWRCAVPGTTQHGLPSAYGALPKRTRKSPNEVTEKSRGQPHTAKPQRLTAKGTPLAAPLGRAGPLRAATLRVGWWGRCVSHANLPNWSCGASNGSVNSASDTLGLLLNVVVHPANIQDRDGAFHLLRRARRLFPFIERIFADGEYAGRKMAMTVWRTGAWSLQIVKHRTLLDLRCYLNGGSSNERSHGLVVTVAWLATSNATQRPLLHSSASP